MIKCDKGKEIKILQSAAGYYLGSVDKDGDPYCRCSRYYYENEHSLKFHFNNGTLPIRRCIENELCGNCILKEIKNGETKILQPEEYLKRRCSV